MPTSHFASRNKKEKMVAVPVHLYWACTLIFIELIKIWFNLLVFTTISKLSIKLVCTLITLSVESGRRHDCIVGKFILNLDVSLRTITNAIVDVLVDHNLTFQLLKCKHEI